MDGLELAPVSLLTPAMGKLLTSNMKQTRYITLTQHGCILQSLEQETFMETAQMYFNFKDFIYQRICELAIIQLNVSITSMMMRCELSSKEQGNVLIHPGSLRMKRQGLQS